MSDKTKEPSVRIKADTSPHDEERLSSARYATEHANEAHQEFLKVLHADWKGWNKKYFYEKLVVPHIELERTPPRGLVEFAEYTGNGARVKLGLAPGLTFDPNPEWVNNPWPADGTRNIVKDLLLRLSVRQYVYEVHGVLEKGYDGYGPRFVEVAHKIGLWLKLPPVVSRRRAAEDQNEPVGSGWPCNVRPEGYYGDDVTAKALRMAGVRGPSALDASPVPPSVGLLELIRLLIDRGRADRAREVADRHIEWLRRISRLRPARNDRAERGLADVDGGPLGRVVFDPAWMRWEGGVVASIARVIRCGDSYAEMPVLADALEEAGCVEGKILRHLREPMRHTKHCWVLSGLLALGGADCR